MLGKANLTYCRSLHSFPRGGEGCDVSNQSSSNIDVGDSQCECHVRQNLCFLSHSHSHRGMNNLYLERTGNEEDERGIAEVR